MNFPRASVCWKHTHRGCNHLLSITEQVGKDRALFKYEETSHALCWICFLFFYTKWTEICIIKCIKGHKSNPWIHVHRSCSRSAEWLIKRRTRKREGENDECRLLMSFCAFKFVHSSQKTLLTFKMGFFFLS